MKRLVIIGVVIVIAIGFVFYMFRQMPTEGYGTISPQQLQSKLDSGEKLTIVDLRDPGFFQQGHITGSVNIPFGDLQNRLGELKQTDQIVLVCYVGDTSQVAGKFLAEKGYANIWSMTHGMAGWTGKLVR